MPANPPNLENTTTKTTPLGQAFEAEVRKFYQHPQGAGDSFSSVHQTLKAHSSTDRLALFNDMSSKTPVTDLPDLKLTGTEKPSAKVESTPDAKAEVKPDAKVEQKQDGKPAKSHEATAGSTKEIPGSTNYTRQEHDDAHPGQIVEKTYDKSGKLIPDAPVKLVESHLESGTARASSIRTEQKFDNNGRIIPNPDIPIDEVIEAYARK